jgi:hypothetical protein
MKRLLLTALIIVGTNNAFCQFENLKETLQRTDSINTNHPREKLFIHYDKPYYKAGDTLWLKGYLATADENIGTDSSKIAYIEIINPQNEIVKRISTPCIAGGFFNNITLTKDEFKQGYYLLRAYTNWMRNFGDSLFFESHFKIIDPALNAWAISFKNLSIQNNRLSLEAVLKNQNKQALINKKVTVSILLKNKDLFRYRTSTDYVGNLRLDTLLKNNLNGQTVVLEISDRENLFLQMPVKAKDSQNIDLQFLPEGGAFIAGKMQKLGFKALNTYGKGIDANGVIKDSKGQQITTFTSIFKGMGTVSFIPELNETYTAFLENGLTFPLPAPQESGTFLQVVDNGDSLALHIDASQDLVSKDFYFSASSKGITCARGRVKLPFNMKLSKTVFPSGIAHFLLFNEANNIVNERVFLIWHNDSLKLEIITNKQAYLPKDSVMLLLKAKNQNNKNVEGHFSMAIIDTGQVKFSPNMENLLSYMVLSSDLKGEIEEPYYYFQHPQPEATDALMLTQGWVNYSWPGLKIIHDHEKDFSITGKITNIFNKPFVNSSVTLFGKEGSSNGFFMDTVTNEKGDFTFNHFPYFTKDSVTLVIKALNRKGKAFNVGVELQEPNYPSFTADKILASGENILFDTVARRYITDNTFLTEQIKKDGRFLPEVVVTAKMKIKGSKNLNDNGGADETITETTLDKTPKETLLDVLYKKVDGFRLGTMPRSPLQAYFIKSNIVRVIIDGVDLHFLYEPTTASPNEWVIFLDTYLKYFSAEDITAIEVMNSPKYNVAYKQRYLSIGEIMSSNPVMMDFSFIEVTTKTGEGPFTKKTPGIYLYKPLAPFFGKQFYSPRYSSSDEKTIFPDVRSTVYWNPEVITDRNGEARIAFYTTESKSGYIIVLQGEGFTGGIGVLYKPLPVASDQKPVAGALCDFTKCRHRSIWGILPLPTCTILASSKAFHYLCPAFAGRFVYCSACVVFEKLN